MGNRTDVSLLGKLFNSQPFSQAALQYIKDVKSSTQNSTKHHTASSADLKPHFLLFLPFRSTLSYTFMKYDHV